MNTGKTEEGDPADGRRLEADSIQRDLNAARHMLLQGLEQSQLQASIAERYFNDPSVHAYAFGVVNSAFAQIADLLDEANAWTRERQR